MKLKYTIFAPMLMLLACSSAPPVQYHTLSNIDAMSAQQAVSNRYRSLGLGPIKLPTLLDRRHLVLRTGKNVAHVSDDHQWGGELEDEFLEALQERLLQALPKTDVMTVPWTLQAAPHRQVSLSIRRFDGRLGGQATLSGQWRLEIARTGSIQKSQRFHFVTQAQGNDVSTLVAAQAQLLDRLAKDIVTSLP